MAYQHILLATDLHPNGGDLVIHRASQIAQQHQAQLSIIHVVEHLSAYGMAQAYPAVISVEQELVQEAKEELTKLTEKYQIKPMNVLVEIGSPKILIIEAAKKYHADLIIVGSHGRHGLSLLLGSTANAVLHHAPCDVLAIRLQE